jgi:gluconate 2-dehydrogenase gamma chain
MGMDKPTRKQEPATRPRDGVSRLGFLKGSGAVVAGAGLAGVLSGCAPLGSDTNETATPETVLSTPQSMAARYPEVMSPPSSPPPADILHVFTPEEATFVDALTSRIFPGDAADPGAHEARVVTYIDYMLSFNHGDAEPTYRKPPFAQTYSSALPPTETTVNGYKVIWVYERELGRYGYQSQHTPLESYRLGLKATNGYALSKFGEPFVHLTPAQQDEIIADLADDAATGFTDPTAQQFFQMLRSHTIEGMFSDPLYGGNRNLVGWKLVGYPGAQRAYTEADIKDQDIYRRRTPQSLADMMPFNPGENANPSVILPVDGSRQR